MIGTRDALIVSALDSGSSGLVGEILWCSWARHLTLTVPLSTQVYKWVPANIMLGLSLRWTSIPSSRGEGEYRNNSTEAGDRRRSDGPLGWYANLLIIT